MSRERAAVLAERQASACAELGSPLYAAVLTRVAQDIRDNGPCATAVRGYEQAPGRDAVALRLLGGVHALVLGGRAPELARHYPSAGGAFDPRHPDACWPAFRDTVATGMDHVRAWMTKPPQTNEVGRANLLVAGLLRAVHETRLPIRLIEVGCSAGLNLRADRFRCVSEQFSWGPADSPVVLRPAWLGAPPGWLSRAAARHPELTVVERHGCDPAPIDPTSRNGALVLRAYLWPDQTERAARLDGALAVAARIPAAISAAGAAEYLASVRPEPGVLTVVWHSVMRQYVPAAEWARASRELDRLAEADPPFAHVFFEPSWVHGRHRFRLALRLGSGPATVVADAAAHGLPAWESGS